MSLGLSKSSSKSSSTTTADARTIAKNVNRAGSNRVNVTSEAVSALTSSSSFAGLPSWVVVVGLLAVVLVVVIVALRAS